jgi:sialate O-acetylesterase
MLADLELLEDRLCLNVSLSSVFADHMVLQRDMPIQITGSAQPGESVAVTLTGPVGTLTRATQASPEGDWSVTLNPLPAGIGYTLAVSGRNRIVLSDILIGDVWVCAGQSNMAFPLSASDNGASAAAQANQPLLRLYDPNSAWSPCNPSSAAQFSAVAYYFGQAIQQDQGVPVGLMLAAVNGSSIRDWTSWDAIQAAPALAPYRQAIASGGGDPLLPPGALFSSMIQPLTALAITGVIWYQGEADFIRPDEYAALFPTMIASWRQAWHQGDSPFLYVQLAPVHNIDYGPLRQVQLDTLSVVPNTAMAVVIDGQAALHPTDKELPADRLALAARALAYGENVTYSGPLIQSGSVLGNQLVLAFKDIGAGLVFRDGVSSSFEVENAPGQWFPANAAIDGSSIRVWNDAVAAPVAVRYAWGEVPNADLYNVDGLPASPFEETVAELSHIPAPLNGSGDPQATDPFPTTVPVVVGQFGSQGVWQFNSTLGTWVQLTAANASLLATDPQGDVAGEFPGAGVWLFRPAAGWKQINGVDASLLAMNTNGVLVAEFPGFGVGEYLPASGWRGLTAANASLLAVDANGDVAADFPGYGVQLFLSATGWKPLNGVDASALAMDGLGDVAANFPGYGVGEYRPATGWALLSGTQARSLSLDANGTLVAEFPGYGVGEYLSASGWRSLTPVDAALLSVDNAGGIFAEFASYGVQEFEPSRGWISLTPSNATVLVVS